MTSNPYRIVKKLSPSKTIGLKLNKLECYILETEKGWSLRAVAFHPNKDEYDHIRDLSKTSGLNVRGLGKSLEISGSRPDAFFDVLKKAGFQDENVTDFMDFLTDRVFNIAGNFLPCFVKTCAIQTIAKENDTLFIAIVLEYDDEFNGDDVFEGLRDIAKTYDLGMVNDGESAIDILTGEIVDE